MERGVTPDRLANALSLDITSIVKKLNVLDVICTEAVQLLNDQYLSANIRCVIRKMNHY